MNAYSIVNQKSLDTDIHLFLLPVAKNSKCINTKIIPRTQQEVMNQYRYKHDIQKRFLARSFCYEFIQEHYCIDNFELDFSEYKKPLLKNAQHVEFNFSYSNNYVLVGISKGKKIGVDIEYVNTVLDVQRIAQEIMCPVEFEEFLFLKDDTFNQQLYFFRLFSKKESITKAFGTGLHFDLKMLNTSNNHVYLYEDTSFVSHVVDKWINDYTLSVCFEVKS